jgi:16S rRNA (cytosine967-C5)-methyltransferase
MRRTPEAIEAALEALAGVRAQRFAPNALRDAIRRRPRSSPEAKADASRLLYGYLRNARLIDLVVGGGDDRARLAAAAFILGEGSSAGLDEQALLEAERMEPLLDRLRIGRSLPDDLAEILLDAFGPEADAIAAALCAAPPRCLRANTLAVARDELLQRLGARGVAARPTPFSNGGIIIDGVVDVFSLPEFMDGYFEIQDEGSQLIGELVAVPPKGTVIDFCAGSGGKSLHLAALLENKGRVVAFDREGGDLEELRRRARRAGASNVGTRESKDRFRDRADRVLVDAPCSGTGVLRRNPENKLWRRPLDLPSLARAQLAILDDASALVRPGGRLIYATCSLLSAENEAVVERFLEAHPSFELVLAKEILGKARALSIGDGTYLRLTPNHHGTDGFFATVMRRR